MSQTRSISRKMRLQLHNEVTTEINNRLTYSFNISDKFKFPLQDPVFALMSLHSAWYSGDPIVIHGTYRSMIGRVGGSTKESFWSKKLEDGLLKLHVPLAADIAVASADVLFAEMPEISIPEAEDELRMARQAAQDAKEAADIPVPPVASGGNPAGDPGAPPIPAPTPAPAPAPTPPKPSPATVDPVVPTGPATRTQERLDEIVENGSIASRLLEAAESCAAMGGVYLVPTWDISLSKDPILAINQADNAIPEFKWGHLVAVSFYDTVYEDQDVTYRRLERHENGKIINGLFKGNKNELGKQVSLGEHVSTANLQETISTMWDGLMLRYVPNMKPNRRFRGSAHGQSDFAGIEPLLDALDEVYTSWMRDVRLARARIIVPESFLDWDDGEKKKPYFDVDKAVYTAMTMDPLSAKDAKLTLHQFDIRAEKHKQTAYELLERIITHAGYSPQTFGLNIGGQSETGTALNLRERKTYVTRQKKWKYWKQPLEDVLEMMLHIDNAILKNGTAVYRPTITLVDSMSKDLSSLSTVLQTLHNAEAVSLDTKVRLLHPDWSEEAIQAEIELIKDELGGAVASAVADPTIPNPLVGGPTDPNSDPSLDDIGIA